jgi:uncharacterized protein (TIGR00255 family)
MTGFGRGEAERQGRSFTVEVHSVNHRFLEVRCRVPKQWMGLEFHVQRAVQARFARGHFEVTVQARDLESRGRTLRVDLPLARQYVEALRRLKQELDLAGEVSLALVAGQRDLIDVAEAEESLEEAWDLLAPAVAMALDALAAMRVQEGDALVAAMQQHLQEVEDGLGRINARLPALVQAQRDRLRSRVAELMDGRPLDPMRLAQEVALLAERGDVAEECDRLASHLAQFRAALSENGPQGRRLEFLLQEIHREINTLGSKAADVALVQDVVAAKGALERLREQVQNLE